MDKLVKLANFVSETIASQTIVIPNKDLISCAVCGHGRWDGCQCPLTKEEVLGLTSQDFGEEVVSRSAVVMYVFKSGRRILIPYLDTNTNTN